MPRFRSVLLALATIPGFLIAQVPPDSQPFHRGQWAMQFGGGSDLFSLGVLLFTSPRSAWLLDFSNSVTVLDGELVATAVPDTTSSDQQQLFLSARIGRRFYQAPVHKVVSFQTITIESGFSDLKFDDFAGHFRRTIWNAGLNAEVGGAYMLTPGVSVGGTAAISAGYLALKQDVPGSSETGHGYYFNGVRVLFALGLYF